MIQTETIIVDGREFVRTWSDSGKTVVRDGIAYDEAIDPAEFGRQYTEGEPIQDIPDEEALSLLLEGVTE